MYDRITAPNGKEYHVAVASLSNLRLINDLIPKWKEMSVETMLEMPALIDSILGEGSYNEIFGGNDDCVSVMMFTAELVKVVTEGFKAKIGEYKSESVNEPASEPAADNG